MVMRADETRSAKRAGAVQVGGAAVLALALLEPVGDPPWISFWREWTACVGMLLIVLSAVSALRDARAPLAWRAVPVAVFSVLLIVIAWLQWATGTLPYLSDALIVSVYLSGFGACAVVAASLPEPDRDALADRLAAAFLAAALVSVPIAILQWADLLRLEMNMRPLAGRPVAHMEQTNLLCSLLLQGMFGAWRLASRRRLDARLASCLAFALLLGVILTQSRVAWLVGAATVAAMAWRRRLVSRPLGAAIAVMVAVLAVGTLLLPLLDEQLGLRGTTLAERASEGRRPEVWRLFLDAISQRPWVGWGALQNGPAQYEVALSHPPAGYYFSGAHDVALDLMLWFGVPLGVVASLVLVGSTVWNFGRLQQPAALPTRMAALALVLHGLVELPLDYVFFLFPLGLYLGLGSRLPARNPSHATARVLMPLVALLPTAALALLARAYIEVAPGRPILEIDRSTGTSRLTADGVEHSVAALDQLQAFQALAAMKLQAGATPAELEAMRTAMRRQPYVPVLQQGALILGLNGNSAEALDVLERACRFSHVQDCERQHRVWAAWRRAHPELPDWPLTPTAR